MTWMELYEAVRKQTSREEYAANIIGHLMDDYGSYEWDERAPDGALSILK